AGEPAGSSLTSAVQAAIHNNKTDNTNRKFVLRNLIHMVTPWFIHSKEEQEQAGMDSFSEKPCLLCRLISFLLDNLGLS
ncbi:MAG: hypothetical protein KDE04_17830, partial [Anaerolineales bacterium]|nr:hypothetical protein [Anaerolineales bacterium]